MTSTRPSISLPSGRRNGPDPYLFEDLWISRRLYQFSPVSRSYGDGLDLFHEQLPGNFILGDTTWPACATPRARYTLHELRLSSPIGGLSQVEALSFDSELRCANSSSARFSQYRYKATRTVPRIGALALEHTGPILAGAPVQFRVDGEAGAYPLEYKFWRYRVSTGVWSEVQDYSLNPTYTWTPTDVDTYYFQVWARTRGSLAAYDTYRPLGPLTVQPVAASVEQLTADLGFPAQNGRTITWTALARGGVRWPLEYQFWHFSKTAGWQIAQPYGPRNTFRWTPTWNDEGTNAVQASVRSAGSSAQYQGWKSSGLFTVVRAPLQMTTTTPFPVAPGTPITWQAGMDDHVSNLEFQFWVFTASAGWMIAQPYGPSQTFTWTPMVAGMYALQVWARPVGSTASYEAWRSTNFIQISQSPPRVDKLSDDVVEVPIAQGSTITWTAAATGGTSRLQYQFWRFDATGWSIVQPWGYSNTYSWTPTLADSGLHYVQARVRSTGSTAEYEAYLSAGRFIDLSWIVPIDSLTASVPMPGRVGQPITWTATSNGRVIPTLCVFYRLDPTNSWHSQQAQFTSSPSCSYTWTPGLADVGLHEVQVQVGGVWRSSGFFKIIP